MYDKKSLEKLDTSQLEALIADATDILKTRQRAKVNSLLNELETVAEQIGVSVDDLVAARATAHAKKKGTTHPVKIKYRHPEHPEQTWTGRGKKPLWLQEALEAGHKLEDFLL
jgi:DNA-binding protein H-NS